MTIISFDHLTQNDFIAGGVGLVVVLVLIFGIVSLFRGK